MKGFLKNTIIIVSLVAIVALGYYLFVIEKDSTITSNSVGVSQVDVETQQFLRKLRIIESLNVSVGIFSNPTFNSLVNFTTPVKSVPAGRDNPFAG